MVQKKQQLGKKGVQEEGRGVLRKNAWYYFFYREMQDPPKRNHSKLSASQHTVNVYVQWAVLNLRVLCTHKSKHWIIDPEQWTNQRVLYFKFIYEKYLIFFYP